MICNLSNYNFLKAIWLLPLKNQYGAWPASGEIDILEGRGNSDLADKDDVQIGVEQVAQTVNVLGIVAEYYNYFLLPQFF